VGDAATINHTWGYREGRHDWKSPGEVTFKLVDIVSKGGNYLLNVGPMADGTNPSPEPGGAATVGRWLKLNGEAVYGAGPTPFRRGARGAEVRAGRRTLAGPRSSSRARSGG